MNGWDKSADHISDQLNFQLGRVTEESFSEDMHESKAANLQEHVDHQQSVERNWLQTPAVNHHIRA